MKIRVAAIAFCRRHELLVVRKRGTTAFMLPGGKYESGEDALACAAREVGEELGIGSEDYQARPLGRFMAPAANEPGAMVDADIFFAALAETPRPSAEIDEVQWIDMRRCPDTVAPLLREYVVPGLLARLQLAHRAER